MLKYREIINDPFDGYSWLLRIYIYIYICMYVCMCVFANVRNTYIVGVIIKTKTYTTAQHNTTQ